MDDESRININLASAEELTELPGVGPVLAGRLVAARPFEAEDDIRQVSGVGEALMERIWPRVVFNEHEAGLVPEVDPAAEASEGEGLAEVSPEEGAVEPVTAEAEPAAETSSLQAVEGEWITRSQAVWGMVAAAIVSILLSVSLTLAIVVAINNTLDFQRHQAVQDLRTEISDLDDSLGDVDSRLSGLSSRMEALEGLSGRVTTMEDEVGGMQDQMQEAITQVGEMRASMEDLSGAVDDLDRRTDRLDQFLEGLRNLINGLDDGGQAGEG